MGFLLLVFLVMDTHAQPGQTRPSGRTRVQASIVITDGAAVYARPSFDAAIIEYLERGTRIPTTLKPVRGSEGLGLFYRTKTPTGKIGYITDVDVENQFQTGRGKRQERNPVFDEIKEHQDNPDRQPIYFTRYLGMTVGRVDYTEKFSGKELSAESWLYGIRATGPGVLFDGPPLDVSVAFSISPPKYYSRITTSPPNGFYALGDFIFPFPFFSSDHSSFHIGLGAMWTYTKFNLRVRNSTFDSQEFRIGVLGDVGYGFRFKTWALRANMKYYWEKTKYLGYWLTIQHEY